jgi:hypothetical protein
MTNRGMTPGADTTTRAGLTGPAHGRTIALAGVVVVAVVVAGALATWLLAATPTGRLVEWHMSAPDAHSSSGKITASTTEFSVLVPAWTCVSGRDLSWLAPPKVTYRPSAVTITLEVSEGHDDVRMCGAWLDTGTWVKVPLTQPLAGRAVFDGSHTPPIERWRP